MARYIDLDNLLLEIGLEDTEENREVNLGEIVTLENIDRVPIEDVEPILRAKWWSQHGWLDQWGQCGICDYITTDKSSMNYCPNCGAKMDKE